MKSKKIIFGLILFCIVFLIPKSVKASSENIKINYRETSNGIAIQSFGIKDFTDMIIPETINGKKVVEISDNAFKDCQKVITIVLPSAITHIGNSAFENCTSLKNIKIQNTTNRSELINNSKNIGAALPHSLKYIGEYAFKDCKKITDIKMPNSVTTLGQGCFYYCSTLSRINISNKITEIPDSAFYCCASLKRATLPNSCQKIGGSAFYQCRSMTSVNIPSGVSSIEYASFMNCTSLTRIEIPSSVKLIDIRAFANCYNLLSIKIPSSIEEIAGGDLLENGGDYSFYYKRVKYSDCYNAFASCSGATVYVTKGSYAEQYVDKYLKKDKAYFNGKSYSESIINGGFWIGLDKSQVERWGYKYSDSFFAGKANVYNPQLATMSMSLAFAAFGADDSIRGFEYADDNVKEVLTNCKFTNYKQYNYHQKPTQDSIGCVIAKKKISGNTLIVVAVRGGGYGAEWASNFTVGKSGDHQGFNQSATTIYKYLAEYISSNNISGNVKFWITGYSRAGAVSNLLAAKLDRTKINKNISYDKNSVFAYCMATPAGADTRNDPHNTKYNNIFSIINYHDPVPCLAPFFWEFDRYGVTKVLDYSDTDYTEREQKMINRFYYITYNCKGYSSKETEYNISSFDYSVLPYTSLDDKSYSMGTFIREFLTSAGNSIDGFSSREKFVSSGMQEKMRKTFSTSGLSLTDGVTMFFKVINEAFSHPIILQNAISNLSILADAHANPAIYLAWMQIMDKNYVGSEAQVYFKRNNLKSAYTVKFPSSNYIYDGKAKTPKLTLTDGSKVLNEGTDYSLSYKNNINAGTGKVIIHGKGSYLGDRTVKFTINRRDISKVTITANFTNNTNIKQDYATGLTLTDGSKKLVKDKDYKLILATRTAVKIVGIGNYTSSITKDYANIPNQVKGLKIKAKTTTTITLQWSKNPVSVTGYRVYRYNSTKKQYEYIGKTTALTYTDKNLKKGTTYQYRVRAYKTVNNKDYLGDFSTAIKVTTNN